MVLFQRVLGRTWMVVVAGSAILSACTSTVLEADVGAGDGGGTDAATTAADASKSKPGELDAGRGSDANGGDPDSEAPPDAGSDADAPVLVDCGAPIGQIFTSALGPFCPFQAGSMFNNCAVGEHCCEYAEEAGVPSTCSAGATACGVEIATGFDWRCDETNDCPGGQVCCFAGAITPHLKCIGQHSASASTHSTACRIGTCAAGEMRTCGSQADCASGTTCTGMRLRGKHFGFCKP